MKKIFTFFSVLLCSAGLSAQVFDVDTLVWSGPTANRINIAILGDGYTAGEQSKFITDATAISNAFFNEQPYKQYKNYINVVAIKVISNQSGVNHPKISSDNMCGTLQVTTTDNYFGSSFDCGGGKTHRLLCAMKDYKVPGVMAANWPDYDQVLIIVNTTWYGGAGGTYAVTSVNATASEIAIHEVGHSFAKLADEYWAGAYYASNTPPNMTNNADINTVKWKPWVGTVGLVSVGLYPHTGDPSWKKPVNGKCKMEYLSSTYSKYYFCPVCTEAHILKFFDLTKPYDAFTPSNASTLNASADVVFDITTVLPIPNTLEIEWTVNGSVLATGASSTYTALLSALNEGDNTIQARLLDKSTLIRSASHTSAHAYTITWTVSKSATTGVSVAAKTDDFKYLLFPNPTNSESDLIYHLNAPASIHIILQDVFGKRISVSNEVQVAGDHQVKISASGLSSGVYILSILKDGVELTSEKVVIE
ncbi:MAG: M64 family metallopeptidase [Flavobacteriales bacterium]